MSDFLTDELIIIRNELMDLCDDDEVMKMCIDNYFKKKYEICVSDE